MFIPVYIVTCCFMYLVDCHNCVLRKNDPQKNAKEALMTTVNMLSGSRFVVESNSYTYALDFCNEVSKVHHPNASVTRSLPPNLENTTIVLGRYNDTDIVGKDSWLLLTFGSGDRINDSSSCNGSEWKSMIMLLCPADLKSHHGQPLELLEAQSNACAAQFVFYTTLLCNEPNWNVGSIFFSMFAIIFFVYFVVGIMYKRFVLGAKGYEQVPNYTFWMSLLLLPRELLRKLLRGENWGHENLEENNPRGRPPVGPADAADEPLLSP